MSESPSSPPRIPGARDFARYLPGALLRVLVPSMVIVVLFTMPFGVVIAVDHLFLVETLFIVFWSVVFLFFFRWQLHTVHRSQTPEARWIEALIVLGVMFISVFARLYRVTSLSAPDSFTTELTPIDAYFYTVGILTTAGTGNVAAVGDFAKLLTIVQMVANVAFIGLLVRVLTSAARKARAARDRP